MLKKTFCVGFLFFALLICGCRKDKVVGVVTPYTIEYPEIFKKNLPQIVIPEDNQLTVEGVRLGRMLFYDKILSGDNTQACASCHLASAGFTDSLQFSVGIDNIAGTRNAMPIVNLGWANTFFWDGRAKSLEDQAFGPVTNVIEMHNTWPAAVGRLQASNQYRLLFKSAFGTDEIDSVLTSKAIAQFERTMISGNSPFDRYLLNNFAIGSSGLDPIRELKMHQGFTLFMSESKGDCFHCHGDQFNPLWTDNIFHNNGLDDVFTDYGLEEFTGNPNDRGKFKTPTLRNLLFTAPYMHDGRFKTLSEVVNHYSFGLKNSSTIDPLMKEVNNGGVQLMPDEKAALIIFLESLTDSSFIKNKDFLAP